MTSLWLTFLFFATQTQAIIDLFRASLYPPPSPQPRLSSGLESKKAGVAERPEAFDHAGLLFDGPPGTAGSPFS